MSEIPNTIERKDNLVIASFVDPANTTKLRIRFPSDMTASQLIESLLDCFELPSRGQDSRKLRYHLCFVVGKEVDSRSGRLRIESNAVVYEEIKNYQEGMFRIIIEMVAG